MVVDFFINSCLQNHPYNPLIKHGLSFTIYLREIKIAHSSHEANSVADGLASPA